MINPLRKDDPRRRMHRRAAPFIFLESASFHGLDTLWSNVYHAYCIDGRTSLMAKQTCLQPASELMEVTRKCAE